MAAAARYAIVNIATDIIVNLTTWDGQSAWTPPEGCAAHLYPTGPLSAGWLWNNGSPVATATHPADVPSRVAAGDFIRALYELGWIADVKAAVSQASPLAQDLWAHASSFERYHPLVIQIATAINKNSDDLDELFRLAATYG